MLGLHNTFSMFLGNSYLSGPQQTEDMALQTSITEQKKSRTCQIIVVSFEAVPHLLVVCRFCSSRGALVG